MASFGVCRLVPEITICATFVAPGSLTAQAPVSVANGEIELSPVQPWQLTQAPSKTILPLGSGVPPPCRCEAGAGGAGAAGKSGEARAGTLRRQAPTPATSSGGTVLYL